MEFTIDDSLFEDEEREKKKERKRLKTKEFDYYPKQCQPEVLKREKRLSSYCFA